MYALLDFGDLRIEQRTEFSQVKTYYKGEVMDDFKPYCDEEYIEGINNFFAGAIEESAFEGCKLLKDVIISSNVSSIGKYAFSDCTNLRKVTIPESIVNIKSCAFFNCECLENLEMLSSVTHIETWAFRGCESLKSIRFPDSISSIGIDIFCECDNIEKIIWKGTTYTEPEKFNKALQSAGIVKFDVWDY